MRGTIVALDSGAPIRRAQVRLIGTPDRNARIATTDDQGRFEFRELPAGRYRLIANKAGFVGLEYGQRRPMQTGTPIEVGDGQRTDRLLIGLPRGGVIAGRITDEFGEPIAEANVSAMRWQAIGGVGRWMRVGPQARTDDLGQYRLFGLSPGHYLVTAGLRTAMVISDAPVETPAEANGFAPTYFPGVPNIGDATRVNVGLGEEGSASFALVAARLASVEGIVTNSQGLVAQGVVQLISETQNGSIGPEHTGRIDNMGRFRINDVAPGRYMARVRQLSLNGVSAGLNQVGLADVTVGGENVTNVAIAMTAAGRIIGRVLTDTDTPLPTAASRGAVAIGPDTTRLRVMATSPRPLAGDFGAVTTAVRMNGTFEIGGLTDPRLIRMTTPPGWRVKSIMLGGRDYIDSPIDVELGQTVAGVEILLTNRVSSVGGEIRDDHGRPVIDTSVIVFPDDPQYWRFGSRHIRSVRPDQQGRYLLDNVPPFDNYLAIAVADAGESDVNDAAYLATLAPRAARFSLREGQVATLNLKPQP